MQYFYTGITIFGFVFTILGRATGTCKVYFMKKDGNKGFSVSMNPKKPSEVLECQYEYGDAHMHVMVNNPHRDMEKCEECKCYQSGYMTCCGIGWKALEKPVAEGCHIKQGANCTYTLVNARDYSLKCGTDVEVNSVTHSQEDRNSALKLCVFETAIILNILCSMLFMKYFL